ncbi:unnamed protein product [Cyclocybe aegerita]|uniref:Uncharacterized protein n=1 Tax=Cyclocybe aegerita TaxID=1973307 RepID=A0A8S0W503_CYCAE|nr:unnamed protein product [Cyclocybe aegerita]
MFKAGGKGQEDAEKWENLERQMVARYNDSSRDLALLEDNSLAEEDVEYDELQFMVPSIGASLALHSAVSHLTHFCAIIPNSAYVDDYPLYDLDPPELPESWHAFDSELKGKPPNAGVTVAKATTLKDKFANLGARMLLLHATPWTAAETIITTAEIAQVDTISSNGDTHVGNFIARAIEKVGKEGVKG